jgi:uncharacterized membrane protein
LTPSEFKLDVLEEKIVRVTFDIPLDAIAGDTENFTLVVFTEKVQGGEGGEQVIMIPTLSVSISMVVQEVISLRWGNIQDANMLPGDTLDYEMTLYNEGNSDASVLMGYQGPADWVLEFEAGESFTIPAFQAYTFNATLTAPENVTAGSTIRLDLSAGVGVMFFSDKLQVTIDQMYHLTVDGQVAKFTDPSQRVTFNLTVTNLGNGDDRVTITVDANGGLWEVSADQNFVDLGIDDNDRTALVHVFVTPPSDSKAFEEKTFTIQFISENDEVSATHDVTANVNPISDFSVETEVLSDSINVESASGRFATYLVHVSNTGNLEDLFHIGLLDLPDGWTTIFESRMLSVPANKRKTVEFSIAPPTGDVTTMAGPYAFKVHVASELGNGDPSVHSLSAVVRANRGHTVRSLEPTYVAPSGADLTFRVLVINEGNIPEALTLSAVGDYETVTFELMELDLEPFGQRVVNVTVELPSTEEDTTVDLQVIATTKDLTNQVHATVPIEVEGRSGVPGPGAMAALAALAVVAVASVIVTDRRRRR